MPDLVHSWNFSKNISKDDRADINRGMEWVVTVILNDYDALKQYGPHPEHLIVKKIQSSMVEDIFVVDTIISPDTMKNMTV